MGFPMGFSSRTGILSPRFPAAEAATEARDPSGFFYHENTSKTIEIQTFLTIKPDITENYVINTHTHIYIYIYVYIYIYIINKHEVTFFFCKLLVITSCFLNMPETIDIYFKTISIISNIVRPWKYLNLFCITFGGRHHHLYDLYRHNIYFFGYFWIASILHIYPIFGHFWMIKLHFTAQQLRSTKMAWLAPLLSYCQISIW